MPDPVTSEPGTPNGMGRSMGQVATMAIVVIAILGLAWLLIELSGFLMLIFATLVLAAIFDTVTQAMMRITRMKRGPSLALSVLLILALIGGVFTLFGSQLAGQFDTIRDSIPAAVDQVRGFLERVGLDERVRDLVEQGSGDLSLLTGQAGGYVLTATSGIANFVMVFVGAIFIAADPAVYRRGLLLLIPRRAENTVAIALDDASRGLRGWMLGQAVASLVVAALTGTGLALLGVPAAVGLGVIAGLLDIIPMVGPIIAAVPAILLAFTVSPAIALWTVVLFLIVQQIESNILQPMIQKYAVDVPPAILLFAVLGAGLLFGFLGVLLAAPLTVVTYVLVQRVYVKTLLGKDINVAGNPDKD
ncbi:MAG: AI-2E family transporter [Alphaproteobacteria bacterium HGW-Alphaproteobacteria-16]|nr:MAG: AI-2E family transporter [Alphaproteobacteria bacterium HGW-Alphaproteobacteria-16]